MNAHIKQDTMRDHIAEGRLFQNRLTLALALCLIAILTLVGRLVYLDILHHEHYITLSQNNRISIVAIPPPRGLIYDRNGAILAQNMSSYSLEIVPEQVEDLDATLAELRKLIEIKDSDMKRFRRMLQQKRYSKGVPLRFRLSEDEVARFAVERPQFPGVDVVAGLSRYYPLGAMAVHVVGYVGRINEEELQRLDPADYSGTTHMGKTGVEKAYEDVLHGTVGFEQIETNAQGRRLRVLKHIAPVAGRNLYLNIDIRLQTLAEAELGENRGAIVAIEPATGAVLALASMPIYDPNPFVNGIETQDYNALAQSPNQPLYNRALRGAYPPGSTLKPFYGLGGLEQGVISLGKNHFCGGYFQLKGHKHRYRDWKRGGHGTVNLDKAIVESCDVYFYSLAQAMGIDRMHSYMSEFGFGLKTGIDLDGELAGLMPSKEWKRGRYQQAWFPGETLIAGIGQGYTLSTPLQLASSTAALANRGRRMQPTIVRASQNPMTQVLTALPPRTAHTIPVTDPGHWDSVIASMVGVLHGARGTARKSGLDATYQIAGKTGTAQVFSIKQNEKYDKDKVPLHLRDHALFIAFAPAEKPRIALAVIVENGSSGSGTAAPIARRILDKYLLELMESPLPSTPVPALPLHQARR